MNITTLKRFLIGFSIGLILGVVFASLAHAGDTSNLEAAYLLNETSGTRIDETANGNDLTDNNTVTSGTGQFGNGASFEKANSEYLSITDASQTGLDITGNLTLLAWINIDASDGNGAFFIDKNGVNTGYGIRENASQTLGFLLGGTDSGVSSSIGTGTLTHVAAVYNGSTGEIFLDGVSDVVDNSPGTPAANSDEFRLGLGSTGGENWDGIMDEAAVFSRDLSSSEINDIMDNGLEAFISPPRNRLIIITGVIDSAPWIYSHVHYWLIVNKHRKKFNVKRPKWMELFDIPEVFAQTVEEKTQTLTEFLNRGKDQENYKTTNEKYKQKLATIKNGITYETYEYVGPRGVGYTQRAIKEEAGKKYLLEKHFGPETDRNIATEWTEIKGS